MLKKSQIAFNRIIYPGVGIEQFFVLTAELGLHKVELRNDLPGNEIIDGLGPGSVRELAVKHDIEILTINALRKFNLPGHRSAAVRELKSLIGLALSIDCRAVVLCPNNDRSDSRTAEQSLRDTVDSLREFRPLFEDSGLLGYVEPLGFSESSLDSIFAAARAIGEAGGACYRIVYDTFHHYLGPDEGQQLEKEFDIALLGIVHASGVEEDLARDDLKDEHRVLITDGDRMGNIEQIERLTAMGYGGNVSLEPFSIRVQELEKKDFLKAAARCLELLTG
jgi:2-keto-myo-inositol isomerase